MIEDDDDVDNAKYFIVTKTEQQTSLAPYRGSHQHRLRCSNSMIMKSSLALQVVWHGLRLLL